MNFIDLYEDIVRSLKNLDLVDDDFEFSSRTLIDKDAKAAKDAKKYSYEKYTEDTYIDDKHVTHREKEYKNGKCVKDERRCDCLDTDKSKCIVDKATCKCHADAPKETKTEDTDWERKYKELQGAYYNLIDGYRTMQMQYDTLTKCLQDITTTISNSFSTK